MKNLENLVLNGVHNPFSERGFYLKIIEKPRPGPSRRAVRGVEITFSDKCFLRFNAEDTILASAIL